jgi:uncharacterized protein YdhG (YjbR/CyaY superfamily)
MDIPKLKNNSMDNYINIYPLPTRKILIQIRNLIHKLVPQATETIKYGIPTFVLNDKNLVHFAAYKNHIGFYPTPGPIIEFKKELNQYKQTKGAIQFPLDKPLPFDLINRIVKFRVKSVLF